MSPYRIATSPGLTRRSFLRTTSLAMAAVWADRALGVTAGNPALPGYPFTLGIASGDPAEDGFVLWTRLAPLPFQPDGGMPLVPIKVGWRVAEDEEMSRIVAQGDTTAVPDWAHSVHVETKGLKPDRWYWYDFRVGNEISPRGRTRTMPLVSSMPEKLRFAFVSCQNYEDGLYTAYQHLANENPDLVIHLGDYKYESFKKDKVRSHLNHKVHSLDECRSQIALYKTDPDLQRIHAQAPFIATWDDHEMKNDYAGAADRKPDELELRANAYKAYYEHMPLRISSLPCDHDMQLYRRLAFGRLADIHVLDTRQYRTKQPHENDLAGALSPEGTILGADQKKWLLDGLTASTSAWNLLANQVPMARVDSKFGEGESYNMDKWAGYELDRRAVLGHLRDRKITNGVVITGDVHRNFANDLLADFDRSETTPVATEFIGTSLSSSGDGEQVSKHQAALMKENPFIKFMNSERGYVSCEVTPTLWQSHYRTVEYVSRPDAPVNTRASFAVEPTRPGLQKI